MNLLPQPTGARPLVACEIAPAGIIAARTAAPGSPLTAAARVLLDAGAVQPSLRPGNLADRVAIVAGLRRALEEIDVRAHSRTVSVTLVVPDGAARVLLLDFEALPTKLTEALPLVRFRLKKMLPFDADTAMVSYQVMRATRSLVRTLVVAMPRDVLAEYESALREAGFEPGAVLPSTLAALAGHDFTEASLVINASDAGVTAAIADESLLLLHRSMDLQVSTRGMVPNLPPALFDGAPPYVQLPLVDEDDSRAEWAAQQPLPEHGRNPYADRVGDEAAVQNQDGVTAMGSNRAVGGMQPLSPDTLPSELFVGGHADLMGAAPITDSPYAAPEVQAEFYPETHQSILLAPTAMRDAEGFAAAGNFSQADQQYVTEPVFLPAVPVGADERDSEIAEAVSVAAAYFEDTLGRPPRHVISAGTLGAAALQAVLERAGVASADGLSVREAVASERLLAGATGVPRSWLAAVSGALSV